jgi:hypothetical protein
MNGAKATDSGGILGRGYARSGTNYARGGTERWREIRRLTLFGWMHRLKGSPAYLN